MKWTINLALLKEWLLLTMSEIKCPRCGLPFEGITEIDIPLCIPCTLADWQKRDQEQDSKRPYDSGIPKREYDEG